MYLWIRKKWLNAGSRPVPEFFLLRILQHCEIGPFSTIWLISSSVKMIGSSWKFYNRSIIFGKEVPAKFWKSVGSEVRICIRLVGDFRSPSALVIIVVVVVVVVVAILLLLYDIVPGVEALRFAPASATKTAVAVTTTPYPWRHRPELLCDVMTPAAAPRRTTRKSHEDAVPCTRPPSVRASCVTEYRNTKHTREENFSPIIRLNAAASLRASPCPYNCCCRCCCNCLLTGLSAQVAPPG